MPAGYSWARNYRQRIKINKILRRGCAACGLKPDFIEPSESFRWVRDPKRTDNYFCRNCANMYFKNWRSFVTPEYSFTSLQQAHQLVLQIGRKEDA